MKSCSLDSLYANLDRQILLVESFLEVKNFSKVLKACRLKPFEYFFSKRNNKIVLYTWWFDEFGNSLKIIKRNKLKIIYGDLLIDRSKIPNTDLYFGISIPKVIKMSKLMFINCGLDEDLYQENILVSFLGIDDRLRTYLYMYGAWQQVSTMLLGIKNLKEIAKNWDLNNFIELSKAENNALPCQSGRVWLSCLPPNEEFLSILDKQCGIVYSLMNPNKKDNTEIYV